MKKLFVALMIGAAPLSAAVAQPAATPAPSKPLPVSVIGQFDTLTSPDISADGKLMAVKVRAKGEKVLAVVPLGQTDAKPQIIASDGEFMSQGQWRVLDWDWFDNENLLIWVSQYTDLEGDKFDVVRLINHNVRTNKRTLVGWENSFLSASNILWRSRSGPPRVYLQRLRAGEGTERIGNPEVVEVNIETGDQRVVQRRNPIIGSWYADGSGTIRMGFGGDRDRGKRLVIYRTSDSKNFDTIVNETSEKYGTGTPVPQIFLEDGRRGIALSRESGYTEAYEIDLATMKLGKKLQAVKGRDILGISSNQEGNALEAISYVEDRPHRLYLDPRLKEIQAGLEGMFGKGNAYIESTDKARENIIVNVGRPNQAGAFYLYNTLSGDMSLIGWANSSLKDMPLNPVKSIRYKASDGKEIHAVLTLPRLRDPKALPLVVMPHGGPWAMDYERFDAWAQALAEYGYAVVQPNYRGSTSFGKEWEAASDGNWGVRMQDDLLDAITHLAREGIADPKRVCIMGWSYGGYAASRAAQRDAEHYRCAISGAGVHDIPDMVRYDKDYLGEYGSKFIGSAASDLDAVSPARHAKDFSIPILIVHGKEDDRVPVSQSRDLVRRLKAAGKVEGRDFVYIEQPKNTHHFPFEADHIQWLEEAKKFLAKHNPA